MDSRASLDGAADRDAIAQEAEARVVRGGGEGPKGEDVSFQEDSSDEMLKI